MIIKWSRFGRALLLPFFLMVSCATAPAPQQADWADVTLHATGAGLIQGPWTASERIEAVQRAKMDAYTRLESQILTLKTGANKSIKEMAEKDLQVQKKIVAFVKGAKILHTENTNQGIEIQTELFLGENFKATLGLAEKKQIGPSKDKVPDGSQTRPSMR